MGTDEWCRHTLIIPNPFKVVSVEDGVKYYPALVLVVAPWWLCRHVFDADTRRDVLEARADEREMNTALKELKKTKPFVWEIVQNGSQYSDRIVEAAYDELFEIRDRLKEERDGASR
jgi:hypothetical protein